MAGLPNAPQPGIPARSGRASQSSRRGWFGSKKRRFVLAWVLVTAIPSANAGTSLASPRNGAAGMSEPRTGSLLADYYENFLRDHDVDTFRKHVSDRYTEGTLARLAQSGDLQTRRAAVLSLGLFGSFATNAAVARAMRDPDQTVRSLAENALWAIWFRADSAENNAVLERISLLNGRQRYDEAITLANRLTAAAPRFAEAYNQRAIAYFSLGRFQESAADCERVLERNPYHIGALGGLAQCQIRLEQPAEALKTLRRAAKLQPFNENLTRAIQDLEGDGH
jgi:tetratricopeptide (TPR) repeat protein